MLSYAQLMQLHLEMPQITVDLKVKITNHFKGIIDGHLGFNWLLNSEFYPHFRIPLANFAFYPHFLKFFLMLHNTYIVGKEYRT